MVQHADLFDQLPGGVIGRHHAERSQPQFPGPRRHVGDEQVGRRRIGCAEMVLAEEDAFEARRLGARPQVEIGFEIAQRFGRIEPLVKLAWRGKELEYPGLYHRGEAARKSNTTLAASPSGVPMLMTWET